MSLSFLLILKKLSIQNVAKYNTTEIDSYAACCFALLLLLCVLCFMFDCYQLAKVDLKYRGIPVSRYFHGGILSSGISWYRTSLSRTGLFRTGIRVLGLCSASDLCVRECWYLGTHCTINVVIGDWEPAPIQASSWVVHGLWTLDPQRFDSIILFADDRQTAVDMTALPVSYSTKIYVDVHVALIVTLFWGTVSKLSYLLTYLLNFEVVTLLCLIPNMRT